MNVVERALRFRCNEAWLYGVVAEPSQASRRGVLIVVGGPQYRAGSHRQFVLLARALAQAGVPVFRFDYRGMGDSEGEVRDFEGVDDDIRAALDKFAAEAPTVTEFVIFGLCDAVCAALSYAPNDPRVHGLILVNPWVRTNEGIARVYLRHYYLGRLLDREFWSKLRQGRFAYRQAARSLLNTVTEALLPNRASGSRQTELKPGQAQQTRRLPDRMRENLKRFGGETLFILSENDLTAKEFLAEVEGSREWQELLASPRVVCRHLAHANHTFSRRDWRDEVVRWMLEWHQSR